MTPEAIKHRMCCLRRNGSDRRTGVARRTRPSEESSDSLFTRSTTMKRSNRIPTVVFLGALLAVLFGCASTSTSEGTGEYFDDSVITTKIKAGILNEPTLSSNQISVETYKGK